MTLPALMHDAHTFSVLCVPRPTIARTVWMFGFQRRRVRLWECDTDMPKPGPLPQTSQTAATENSKHEVGQTATAAVAGNEFRQPHEGI